jgi:hypothetical protein
MKFATQISPLLNSQRLLMFLFSDVSFENFLISNMYTQFWYIKQYFLPLKVKAWYMKIEIKHFFQVCYFSSKIVQKLRIFPK